VSAPPFDSFNLGDHVGDEPSAVAEIETVPDWVVS
jgi:copper oxidase (laccase) domain-containing protein